MNNEQNTPAACPLRLSKGAAGAILLIGLYGLLAGSRDPMLALKALPLVLLVLGPLVVYLHVAPRRARVAARVAARPPSQDR